MATPGLLCLLYRRRQKLAPKETKCLVQGHTGSNWLSQGHPTQEAVPAGWSLERQVNAPQKGPPWSPTFPTAAFWLWDPGSLNNTCFPKLQLGPCWQQRICEPLPPAVPASRGVARAMVALMGTLHTTAQSSRAQAAPRGFWLRAVWPLPQGSLCGQGQQEESVPRFCLLEVDA